MKGIKYYTLVAAMMVFASPAVAQFSIGVVTGANMGNLDIKDDEGSTETLTGFMGGLVFDYAIGTNMAISVQPSYMVKGTTTFIAADIELNLTYIELPILFRYAFGSGNIKPFLEAGPSIGFLSKAEVKSGDQSLDVKENLKNTDFSGSIGAGVDFGLGNNTISAGARYSMGFSTISDGDDIKTNGVQLLVGFKMPIGGK